jgi:transposase
LNDRTGVPMTILTTPANVHDSRMAMALIDGMPSFVTAHGRYRRALRVVLGDKAYGTSNNERGCRRRGVVSLLDRPRSGWPPGLGRVRYVVERTLACLGHCRRIKLCYERTAEHFQAFHELACILLCAKRLHRNIGL